MLAGAGAAGGIKERRREGRKRVKKRETRRDIIPVAERAFNSMWIARVHATTRRVTAREQQSRETDEDNPFSVT
jgi:hypothetical protein